MQLVVKSTVSCRNSKTILEILIKMLAEYENDERIVRVDL